MPEKDILLQLKKILNDYLAQITHARTVFLATLDGHMLLERNKAEIITDQIAPMAGSILGISETMASQILKQNLQESITIMDQNILGLIKVLDKEDSLFLGVICSRMVSIGQMLTISRVTTKAINQALEKQTFE